MENTEGKIDIFDPEAVEMGLIELFNILISKLCEGFAMKPAVWCRNVTEYKKILHFLNLNYIIYNSTL